MTKPNTFSLKSRSLKFKWTFGASAAIFLTFFLFSFAIYQGIGSMLLNEKDKTVTSTALSASNALSNAGLTSSAANLTKENIDAVVKSSMTLRDRMEDQVLVFYDKKGKRIEQYMGTPYNDKAYTKYDYSAYLTTGPTQVGTLSKPTINGQQMVISQMPIFNSQDNATVIGYIQVINPMTSYNSMMGKLLATMFLLGGVALFISGMLGYLLAQNFLNPLTRMAKTMNDIRNNGFQKRIEATTITKDEIGELTLVFNDMMTQIERSFEQQKQFVEDASHELRTPVQIMEGHLKLLNRWGKDDPEVLDESLNASLTELERMKKLVQEMLDLSRAEQISQTKELQIVCVNDVVEQVRRNFEVMHEDFLFTLKEDDKDLHAMIQHNHLEQILIIIADNAVKYSGDSKQIDVHVYQEEQQIKVSVKDYGVGISPEEIDKIFNRFYRVDKARSREVGGNGLGLAIAKELVSGYQGSIQAESEDNVGTTITITLPLIEKQVDK
ncbi:HAMP domain-containing sensor histidine kinase [Listeria booriae]|uniref:Signal transduction histidine-protein kinase ArlS n=1 Tax=Listeria booriae TaxID=1552123 RepID=A0A7X0XLB3_9LIST|nr:HAMP domain-containing histidine kinase [Listeria booriae]MBC1562641.1 HAMP domain-containing histidine kinase [Listeria booriae]MBC1918879.1 HAMP domain-containing histidine kinase [Listeria booriae]MBC2099091.1 HAMP domain-containing histidine kinase [Listeria booriae]MBC2104216.1 HAMP domain-containing histidine kinase [Listeria booriae]MBC2116754.1 HAMP domain-containing histidine kinase [Listeria booriae]